MINSTERSDILVFNCYLCHVRYLLTCYVYSTKIGEISDISKCFENFVSQALGVLTRIYAAELRLLYLAIICFGISRRRLDSTLVFCLFVIIYCLSSMLTKCSGVRLATSMYDSPVKHEKMNISRRRDKRGIVSFLFTILRISSSVRNPLLTSSK